MNKLCAIFHIISLIELPKKQYKLVFKVIIRVNYRTIFKILEKMEVCFYMLLFQFSLFAVELCDVFIANFFPAFFRLPDILSWHHSGQLRKRVN